VAPRPNWKGYLKLSLVSCAVALYPATSSAERVSFRQINKRTGNRLRQQLVDEVTREPVDAEDKGRGYEVGKNQYIPIEDAEIESVQIESTHTIEIDHFVPAAQIDKRYYESPYYVAPNDTVAQEAFAVIREAMRDRKMVALGRVVMAKRERVIALEPEGKGMLGMTLRYPYEVRDSAGYFDEIADVTVPAEMLKLAEHILDTKAADFDPSQFEDHYEIALVEMLRGKQAGFAPKPAEETQRPAQVINLMDALRKSLGQKAGGRGAEKPVAAATGKPAKARKKKAASPEDLRKAPQFKFPIAGGKTKQTAQEPAAKETTKTPARKPAAARKRA
jgi:DNA end-binding protein Ku